MGRFVGKQADGYETRIGRLLPGYELLHLLSRAQLLARLPERARLLSVGCGAGGELAELAGFCLLYTSPSPRDPKTSRMP
ncbi:hypothetical protein KZ869_13850, partial [Pseudomonas aeruginosa]